MVPIVGAAAPTTVEAMDRLERDQRQKMAVRDQLLTARRRRGAAGDAAPTPRPSPSTCSASDAVRRAATVAAYVSVRGRARHRPAAGGARRAAGGTCSCRWCSPTSTSTGRVHDGHAGQRRAAACSSPTAAAGPRRDRDRRRRAGAGRWRSTGAGMRLGRGGGCYDRALGRVPVGTPCARALRRRVARPRCRCEPHDRPVTAVVTPPATASEPACPDSGRPGRPAPAPARRRVAACTASGLNAHGRVSPARPEVGLVGVVRVEGVAAGAGEVHPGGVVEVGERHHHPHRRHPVDLDSPRRRSSRSR